MENSFSVTRANNKRLCVSDLKDCVLCLSNQNLITEEERNIITSEKEGVEVEVFRLLMQKDLKCSFKMLEILKHTFGDMEVDSEDSIQNTSDEGATNSVFPAMNPMKIAAIIHNVFRFLKLEDIKSGRLVSQEWNHVAEPFLRKRSQISVGHPLYSSSFSKSCANFNYVFRSSQEHMPFTALRLTHFKGNETPWPIKSLEEVIKNSWGRNLKELKIDHLKIKDAFNVRNRFEPFNLTDLFPECNITKLDIKIDHHHFQFQNGTWTYAQRLEISLDKIINIKFLRIYGCTIKIKENCRISPVEIEIKDSTIAFPAEDTKNILNQFIDFGKTKRFIHHCHSSQVKLDLKGNFELDVLSLSGIEIMNWNTSNWKIGKLNFFGIPWSGKTSIRVREMTVTDSLNDLTDIPETVEKLYFDSMTIFDSQVSLPNLKHLVFYSYENNLQCFQNCTNLTSLEIQKAIINLETNPNYEFAASSIPPNVRKLLISGSIRLTGNCDHLQLQKLVLDKGPIYNFKTFLEKFKTEEVVIILQKTTGKNINLFKFLEKTDKHLTIGKLKWDKIDFDTSNFPKLVDKKSDYYLFKDKQGIAIEEEEYNKRMKL